MPAGTVISWSQWALHRDARYFPEPGQFRPERWADGLERRIPRFAYSPFGGGPRLCIGAGFAMMVARLVPATVLQRFRFEAERAVVRGKVLLGFEAVRVSVEVLHVLRQPGP